MNPTFTGIVEDMPIEEYHAHPHLSASGIKDLLTTPAHYKKYVRDEKRKPTADMQFSSAVDIFLTEPHNADRLVPLAPDCAKRSKVEKALWAEHKRKLVPGAVSLTREERAEAQRLADIVRNDPLVQNLGILNGAAQTSYFASIDTPEGPCYVRCRPDFYDGGNIIWDLKALRDASDHMVNKAITDYGYHRAAACYPAVVQACGLPADLYVLVIVEKEGINAVRVMPIEDRDVEQGRREFMQAATLWAKCTRTGEWPGYHKGFSFGGLLNYKRDDENRNFIKE